MQNPFPLRSDHINIEIIDYHANSNLNSSRHDPDFNNANGFFALSVPTDLDNRMVNGFGSEFYIHDNQFRRQQMVIWGFPLLQILVSESENLQSD